MIGLSESFEGTWNLSVKCDFTQEPRIWRFHFDQKDKDDWIANEVKLKKPNGKKTIVKGKLTKRASQLMSAFTSLRQQLRVPETYGIQDWLADGARNDLPLIDKDSAILFNHIITAIECY